MLVSFDDPYSTLMMNLYLHAVHQTNQQQHYQGELLIPDPSYAYIIRIKTIYT